MSECFFAGVTWLVGEKAKKIWNTRAQPAQPALLPEVYKRMKTYHYAACFTHDDFAKEHWEVCRLVSELIARTQPAQPQLERTGESNEAEPSRHISAARRPVDARAEGSEPPAVAGNPNCTCACRDKDPHAYHFEGCPMRDHPDSLKAKLKSTEAHLAQTHKTLTFWLGRMHFWEGKFRIVKHENNTLRRKLTKL